MSDHVEFSISMYDQRALWSPIVPDLQKRALKPPVPSEANPWLELRTAWRRLLVTIRMCAVSLVTRKPKPPAPPAPPPTLKQLDEEFRVEIAKAMEEDRRTARDLARSCVR